MTGTYEANLVLEENTLFLSENKFWYSKGLTKMKAFRAYFDFYDVLSEVEDAGARVFVSVGDEETTGVVSIDNGQWIMDNSVYDLQGRRISVPSASSENSVLPKGVYIVNGKKVVVK